MRCCRICKACSAIFSRTERLSQAAKPPPRPSPFALLCRGRESRRRRSLPRQRQVMAPHDESPTSPCKGEVDREAGGRGSRSCRTKETKEMTARARYLRGNMNGVTVVRCCNNEVLSNLQGVLSDLLAHGEAVASGETPTPTLPLCTPLQGEGEPAPP